MKISVFLASMLLSLSAFAQVQMDCTNGNSHLQIDVIQGTNQVHCILINASGVEDASGTLTCQGPQESAFGCDGKMQLLNSKQTVDARLVIAEVTLQNNGNGPIQFNGTQYQCQLAHK